MRIILFEPLYDINVGKICRVMKNFGHNELYIINPIAKLGSDARKYALHAKDILDNAKIVKNFDEVVKDAINIGTTASPENGQKLNGIIPFMKWWLKKRFKRQISQGKQWVE